MKRLTTTLTLQMYSANSTGYPLYSRSVPAWLVDCYIWYSQNELQQVGTAPSSLLAVPNLAAHMSRASVLNTYRQPIYCRNVQNDKTGRLLVSEILAIERRLFNAGNYTSHAAMKKLRENKQETLHCRREIARHSVILQPGAVMFPSVCLSVCLSLCL